MDRLAAIRYALCAANGGVRYRRFSIAQFSLLFFYFSRAFFLRVKKFLAYWAHDDMACSLS
ncbi:MAG: hypothetical protein DMG30_07790 [Acidobacteria bacterium]|nr:MAG: hypothetical protein DMG30_07790 [Acidobacteriota bacterium]